MAIPDVPDPAEVVPCEFQRLDGRGVDQAVAVERRHPVVAQVDIPALGKKVMNIINGQQKMVGRGIYLSRKSGYSSFQINSQKMI